MLLQPFIENVFVHALIPIQKPHTNNFFKANPKLSFCEIKDNGKGMAENLNKLNTSKGIKLARNVLICFNVTILKRSISSSLNAGTTVVLKLQIDLL
jgi:sensor histidine kinase YesM